MKGLILISIIILLAVAILLLRKKKDEELEIDECQAIDNDFSRVKTIPALKCMECQECLMESNGCCSNCSANQQQLETHCDKHDHSHNHQHSHSTDTKGLLPLLLVPVALGLISYRVIKKLYEYRKIK